jgi:Beta-galactosidase trimerisation domain/Beta-galactosidase
MRKDKATRRQFLARTGLALLSVKTWPWMLAEAADISTDAKIFPVGTLKDVPAIRQRAEWRRFIILVWQWQNDVREDGRLYDLAGLHGFHIDRGATKDDLVRLSRRRRFPYYVDHAAGKGILHLTDDLRESVIGKESLLVRPHSLADPNTIELIKSLLRVNVATTSKGLVYAYAFDDEISLGSFNNPAEVDVHPLSLRWYRQWLQHRYGTIQNLNKAWGTSNASFEKVEPVGFEEVRKSSSDFRFSKWDLSRWMEWRHFMDYQFAQVLADLTRYTNKLDPRTPAGFVGGQQPSAYGGYDYAFLCRAVQWMEAYDDGGTNEILRSFWNRPRRIHAQTYVASARYENNVWTLWHRLAHGNQLTIAWPEGWMLTNSSGERLLSPKIQQLTTAFREIQGAASEFIVHPNSYLETDPIGLYYSHPSIRVGWVMDSTVHGASWPRRSSEMDSDNLSSGRLRVSWCKILEDLGYQYEFISYLDVQERRIDLSKRFKVIILPQTICLSDREVSALSEFVKSGGMLIADTLCGLLTETGRGRRAGALDDLFGIRRDESRGYLDGRGIAEIHAEYSSKPFPERLRAYDGSLRYRSMVVFERGTRAASGFAAGATETAQVLIQKKTGLGQSLYLNLTPLAYEYFPYRLAEMGKAWREVVAKAHNNIGLRPRVEVVEDSGNELWMEALLWRNGNRYCLAILKNVSPSEDGVASAVDSARKTLTVRINLPVKSLRNSRTGKVFGDVASFTDEFNTLEANLYEFALAK